jgi:hypothetical protein
MKVLRFLLILILILVVGYLVLCAVSSKEVNVEKSITINAPTSVVWDQMVHFKNWPNWSPWEEMDSTITNTFSGIDGEPGSTSHYTSENSGEGKMTNTGVNGMEMRYDMQFIKPIPSMTNGVVKVVEEGGMSRATQTFHQDVPFLWRGASALMGGEKFIGSKFERGLQLLKEYSEAHAASAPAPGSIQDVQFSGGQYAAIRKTLSTDDMVAMQKFFAESYAALGRAAAQRINGPNVAISYTWDTVKHQTDMAAAFPVSGPDPVPGATMISVPASSAYMMEYKGGYYGVMPAHMQLGQHVAANGKTRTLVVEEYTVTAPQEPDSNKWVTKIYYLYK